MYAKEGRRGTRDEDARLVDSVVGRIKGTVVFEWSFAQREEKSRRNALIYGVFGDVDQEEWQHTVRRQ